MNAKQAKRIRQALRLHGLEPTSSSTVADASLPGIAGTRRLQPDSGRSVYRRLKQLNLDPKQK
ncbi:hypothetical protein [Geminicoccus flavidas]|uniref:hypothetical protein n=1 Tax=Geminicoccus flavidas TaxID=2506407 RepID=UPI00135AA60B|nr:hypothetical protein [Geminicoccus flavidas]